MTPDSHQRVEMTTGRRRPHDWSDADLGEMLRHELRSSLEVDLSGAGGEGADEIRRFSSSGSFASATVGELLSHANPPIELLRRLKEFAKTADGEPLQLPSSVAIVLYYAAIAAARVHAGKAITDLPPGKVQEGLRWAAERPWADGSIRGLCAAALACNWGE